MVRRVGLKILEIYLIFVILCLWLYLFNILLIGGVIVFWRVGLRNKKIEMKIVFLCFFMLWFYYENGMCWEYYSFLEFV